MKLEKYNSNRQCCRGFFEFSIVSSFSVLAERRAEIMVSWKIKSMKESVLNDQCCVVSSFGNVMLHCSFS